MTKRKFLGMQHLPWDIEVIKVDQEFIVSSGAFVGSTSDLTLDTKWQGFTKGIFGTNMFMLKTVGTGDMFVNGWGGILRTDLDVGERMVLDNSCACILVQLNRLTLVNMFKTI